MLGRYRAFFCNKLRRFYIEIWEGACMKNIVISADGDRKVYLVPDVVASDLQKYCNDLTFRKTFINSWQIFACYNPVIK